MIPACKEFKKLVIEGVDGLVALEAAVSAAKKGRDGTAMMSARFAIFFLKLFNKTSIYKSFF